MGKIIVVTFRYLKEFLKRILHFLYYPQQILANISHAEDGENGLLGISIRDSKSLLKYRPIFGNYILMASKWKTLFVISCNIFV